MRRSFKQSDRRVALIQTSESFKHLSSPLRCEPKPGWRHEEEIPLTNNSVGGGHQRGDITASWTHPPIGLFTSIGWRGDVVWGGGAPLPLKMDLKEESIYPRCKWQWWINLTVFSKEPGMRTRRSEWWENLFFVQLIFIFVNMFTYDRPWSLWNECERDGGTDESSSTLRNIICI